MAEQVWVLHMHGDQDLADETLGVVHGVHDAVADHLRDQGKQIAELLEAMHGGKSRITLLGSRDDHLRVYVYNKQHSVTVIATRHDIVAL